MPCAQRRRPRPTRRARRPPAPSGGLPRRSVSIADPGATWRAGRASDDVLRSPRDPCETGDRTGGGIRAAPRAPPGFGPAGRHRPLRRTEGRGRDVATGLRPDGDAQIVPYRRCQHERRGARGFVPDATRRPVAATMSSPAEPAGHRGPRMVLDGRHRPTHTGRPTGATARGTANHSEEPERGPIACGGSPFTVWGAGSASGLPRRGPRRSEVGARNAGGRSRRSVRSRPPISVPIPAPVRPGPPAAPARCGAHSQPGAA